MARTKTPNDLRRIAKRNGFWIYFCGDLDRDSARRRVTHSTGGIAVCLAGRVIRDDQMFGFGDLHDSRYLHHDTYAECVEAVLNYMAVLKLTEGAAK